MTLCLQQMAKEKIPERNFDLIDIDKNPKFGQRKREILAELGRGDDLE